MAEIMTNSQGIRSTFDANAGSWVVEVIVGGEWVEVASHCEKYEAEECIENLCRWLRRE